MLATFLGFKAFFKREKDKHIGIKADNFTAVAYINNMGGMTSELLNELAKSIWRWCRKQNSFLSAQHVPGIENVTADYKSTIFNDTNEWMLKKNIFVRICILTKVDL